jgi:cytidine deaminase
MQMDTLFQEAQKIANMAYAPYSNFRVGAALLCEDGKIVTGVNVENRSFGLTTCAERNSITTAAALGYRYFIAIAVSTPDSEEPTGPCGACRQVLSEFMPPEAPVRFAGKGAKQVNTSVGELYPLDSLHELRR